MPWTTSVTSTTANDVGVLCKGPSLVRESREPDRAISWRSPADSRVCPGKLEVFSACPGVFPGRPASLPRQCRECPSSLSERSPATSPVCPARRRVFPASAGAFPVILRVFAVTLPGLPHHAPSLPGHVPSVPGNLASLPRQTPSLPRQCRSFPPHPPRVRRHAPWSSSPRIESARPRPSLSVARKESSDPTSGVFAGVSPTVPPLPCDAPRGHREDVRRAGRPRLAWKGGRARDRLANAAPEPQCRLRPERGGNSRGHGPCTS
jgi:hypothetical protein